MIDSRTRALAAEETDRGIGVDDYDARDIILMSLMRQRICCASDPVRVPSSPNSASTSSAF